MNRAEILPEISAVLDLSASGELSVHDFLTRATTGRSPLFRALAVLRKRKSLWVVMVKLLRDAWISPRG